MKTDENHKYKTSKVKKNMHQLSTARHRLFELNVPIDLVNPKRRIEKFDPKSIKNVYLISALLGKSEDYYSALTIVDGKIIHTFTREFTEIILKELDTVRDFVQYLKRKEEFFSHDVRMAIEGGEKELLAYYLWNGRSFEEKEKPHFVAIQEGFWEELQHRPECIAKKNEDKISYEWDSIINRVHTCGKEYERVARELARTNRFERRCLSKAFFEAHVKAHYEQRKTLLGLS